MLFRKRLFLIPGRGGGELINRQLFFNTSVAVDALEDPHCHHAHKNK